MFVTALPFAPTGPNSTGRSASTTGSCVEGGGLKPPPDPPLFGRSVGVDVGDGVGVGVVVGDGVGELVTVGVGLDVAVADGLIGGEAVGDGEGLAGENGSAAPVQPASATMMATVMT